MSLCRVEHGFARQPPPARQPIVLIPPAAAGKCHVRVFSGDHLDGAHFRKHLERGQRAFHAFQQLQLSFPHALAAYRERDRDGLLGRQWYLHDRELTRFFGSPLVEVFTRSCADLPSGAHCSDTCVRADDRRPRRDIFRTSFRARYRRPKTDDLEYLRDNDAIALAQILTGAADGLTAGRAPILPESAGTYFEQPWRGGAPRWVNVAFTWEGTVRKYRVDLHQEARALCATEQGRAELISTHEILWTPIGSMGVLAAVARRA
jgi:hypothetical protein